MYRGIALCAKTKGGKDSVFAELQKLSPKFTRLSFADELKSDLSRATGLNMHDASTREQHRWLLKDYGTLMRKFDEDIWVKRAMSKLEHDINMATAHHSVYRNVPVVTDCRYLNEASVLDRNSFMLVRLDVLPETIEARGGMVSDHPSETELDSYNGFHMRFQSENFTPAEIAAKIVSQLQPELQS